MRSLLIVIALALCSFALPAQASGCGCERSCRADKAECVSRCDSPGMPGRKPCLQGCAMRAKSCRVSCGVCLPAPHHRKKKLLDDDPHVRRERLHRRSKSSRSARTPA